MPRAEGWGTSLNDGANASFTQVLSRGLEYKKIEWVGQGKLSDPDPGIGSEYWLSDSRYHGYPPIFQGIGFVLS